MSHQDDPLAGLTFTDPEPPRPEISAAIRAECTKDLCPKRRLSAHARLLLSLGISAAVLGLIMYLTSGSRPEGTLRAALFAAAGWGVVQAAVLFVGLARPPGKRGSRTLRLALAIGVPLAFLLFLTLTSSRWLPWYDFTHTAHGEHAVSCGLHALLFGALASGGMLLVWRGTDPLSPGLSGALAGLVGGLAGAVAIGAACPTGEAWHLWLAHGLTVVVFVVLGWAVGRRWLAP